MYLRGIEYQTELKASFQIIHRISARGTVCIGKLHPDTRVGHLGYCENNKMRLIGSGLAIRYCTRTESSALTILEEKASWRGFERGLIRSGSCRATSRKLKISVRPFRISDISSNFYDAPFP
jgi:hypothetical protein